MACACLKVARQLAAPRAQAPRFKPSTAMSETNTGGFDHDRTGDLFRKVRSRCHQYAQGGNPP